MQNKFLNDCDVWHNCQPEWMWIYDKLIVAQRQGVLSGPAGIKIPKTNWYIVRPITNIRMMGRGAKKVHLNENEDLAVPDGFFWSEVLSGDHISVDYHWGEPVLSVQGFKDDDSRLDRFDRWIKTSKYPALPDMLKELGTLQEWINVEYIGDKIIEIHLRYNDDFRNHDSNEIIPRWIGQEIMPPEGWAWYDSPAWDRVGFWIKNNK